MRRLLLIALLSATATFAQVHATHTPPQQIIETPANPLSPLDFLLGTWSAQTNAPGGSSSATVIGTYTFSRDLGGHALQRTGTVAACKGPQDFDCNHHDQLTIFPDPAGEAAHRSSLFALYLDNEGHVIYYIATTPDPHTVVFLSQGKPNAPKFRLTYQLEGTGTDAVMTGKFQMAAPGSDDFHSYLEWFGTRI